MDSFTQKRLVKFVGDFRAKSGTAPTLKDFEQAGLSKELVEDAVHKDILEMFYINLTSGSVVKTYKLKQN
jgi:hypothetical protein